MKDLTVVQRQETRVLKTLQCEFESHQSDQILKEMI